VSSACRFAGSRHVATQRFHQRFQQSTTSTHPIGHRRALETSICDNSPGPASSRSIARLGASACTMQSHLVQFSLLWTYVRDDRPAGDSAARAVWFAYSQQGLASRIAKGNIACSIWESFAVRCRRMPIRDSISFMKMVASSQLPGWAHVRRHFYDLEQAHGSPVAREALQRIGALYRIEEPIRGRPPEERRAVSQAQAKPLLDALQQWLEATLSKLSLKSETTVAIRYALSRWNALTRLGISPPACRPQTQPLHNNAGASDSDHAGLTHIAELVADGKSP